MRVDIFNNENDLAIITKWYEQRGLEPIEARFLGQGFIVKDYAAVFVYATGTPICLLENLITNKNANAELRDEAIDLLVTTVTNFLKLKSCELIKAQSTIDVVTKRALDKHGFEQSREKYVILTKRLS